MPKEADTFFSFPLAPQRLDDSAACAVRLHRVEWQLQAPLSLSLLLKITGLDMSNAPNP